MGFQAASKPLDDTPKEPLALSRIQERFYASEHAETARRRLEEIVASSTHDTESSSRQGDDLDFVERHMLYLSTHPQTNLTGYFSNLRLMTRIK